MTDNTQRAGLVGFARRLIMGWALAGGGLLVAVVLVNAYSILAGAIVNKPFPGDFELTEMGVAIAAFAFLPYCQLVGANVSADIFTMRAGPVAVALMGLLAAIVAVAFGGLLIWRMSSGLADYIEYAEITGILSIPLWWAFVPAVLSLVLVVVAALINVAEQIELVRRGRPVY